MSTVALAAPRDKAAGEKIDEAINQYYLATQFDKAEAILTGTIKACGDKCSPGVIAKAWMYVGIVRGSGKSDQAGAKEAFQKALDADPSVKLDGALATPDTKKTFESVSPSGGGGGGGGGTPAETPAETPKKHHRGEDEAGNMTCTPDTREVQTRRLIPVSCTTDEDGAVRGELKYKAFGEDSWKTVKMHKKGDFWQAEVPCGATELVGPLKVYVRVQDKDHDTIDSWGSKTKPVEFSIKNETDAEAPAYPDKDPPDRCKAQVECPPGLPGCKSGQQQRGSKVWGDSCEESQECQSGLVCSNGQCDTAQTCDVDADCATGKCVGGTCQSGSAGGGPSGPYKKNWIGIHAAWDLAIIGGTDVCSPDSQANSGYACFDSNGNQYAGTPQPGRADSITTGVAPSTIRLMLSYDRAVTPNITVGARLGYAFNGGPASNGKSFLPFHAELKLAYWIGKNVLAKKGLRPYVSLGGGMAQVDAKLPVTILDCGTGASTNPQCVDGSQNGNQVSLDAWKKLGQSFIAAGGGAMYALTPNSGLQLNVNIVFMLPTSGQVIEPSLGYVIGL